MLAEEDMMVTRVRMWTESEKRRDGRKGKLMAANMPYGTSRLPDLIAGRRVLGPQTCISHTARRRLAGSCEAVRQSAHSICRQLGRIRNHHAVVRISPKRQRRDPWPGRLGSGPSWKSILQCLQGRRSADGPASQADIRKRTTELLSNFVRRAGHVVAIVSWA